MQTHRFIRKDDLTTGKRFTTELTAEDAARLYTTEQQTYLCLGQTIRIGHVLHVDLNAHVDANRSLADVMTRLPRGVRLASLAEAMPADAPSVATSDADLAELLCFAPHRTPQHAGRSPGQRFGKGLS